jgi:hypothetical protein
MDPASTIVRIALTVLNAHAAGAPIDAEDVLKLRAFAGPESAEWDADVVAAHVIAVQARRSAPNFNTARAGH